MAIKTSKIKKGQKPKKTGPRKKVIKTKKHNKSTPIISKDKVDKGGRPPEIDDDVVQKLISFIMYDGTERDACKYAVVPRTTYLNWKKKNYKITYQFVRTDANGASTTVREEIGFADLIDYARLQATASARITLVKASQKGNVTAAIELLKRRDQRYRDKIDVDNTGSLSVNYGGPKSKFTKKQPPTGSNDENDES